MTSILIKKLSHELEQLKTENKSLSEKLKKISTEYSLSKRSSEHFRTELLKQSPRKNPNKYSLQLAEQKIAEKEQEIQALNRALKTQDIYIKQLQEKCGEESSPDSLKEEVANKNGEDTSQVNCLINSLPAMRKLDFSINKNNRKTPVNNELLPNTKNSNLVGNNNVFKPVSSTFSIIQEIKDDEMSKDSIGPELFTSKQLNKSYETSHLINSNTENTETTRVRGFTPIQDFLDENENDNAVDASSNPPVQPNAILPTSKSDSDLKIQAEKENLTNSSKMPLYKPVPRSKSCPPTNLPQIKTFVINKSSIKSLETVENEENNENIGFETQKNQQQASHFNRKRFRQHSGPAILGKNSTENYDNFSFNPPNKRSK